RRTWAWRRKGYDARLLSTSDAPLSPFVGAGCGVSGGAAADQPARLRHEHRRADDLSRPAALDADLPGGVGPVADLRPARRAELRAGRVSVGRRLRGLCHIQIC